MSLKKDNKKNETVINASVLSETKRKMNSIKQLWDLFTKNKMWICSALFIASVIHSIIHYGMYGINILAFATITDTFINFTIIFIPFVVLLPFCIFLYLLPDGNTKIEAIIFLIIKIVLLIISSFILSCLFINPLGGGLCILYVLGVLWLFYSENKKAFTWICLLMLFMVSFIAPFENHTTALIDRISFKCFNKEYNLADIKRFYYIGGSSDYFFVFDRHEDRVEILPKSECQNITRPIMHWNDLWKKDEIKNNGINFRVKRKR